MRINRFIAFLLVLVTVLSMATGCKKPQKEPEKEPETEVEEKSTLLLHYSLDEEDGSLAKESVSGLDYTINYVFNEQNADTLFKEPNEPLRRTGVSASQQ